MTLSSEKPITLFKIIELRLLVAICLIVAAICLIPSPRSQARTGGHEKTFIAYPGDCDDSGGWYMKDSDKTSVTLACWQEDSDDSSSNPD